MTITPELAEIIADAIDDRMIDLHTSLPAAIQTYDSATQTATVELQLQRLLEKEDGTLTAEELPVLQNVKVVFTRTAKFFSSFPIEPGDTGDVIFSEASIGQWRASDSASAPDDTGRHTLSGAKFYPGLSKDSEALVDDLSKAVWGRIGGAKVTIDENDEIEINDGTTSIILDGSGAVNIDNGSGTIAMDAAGQVDINGNFTVDP